MLTTAPSQPYRSLGVVEMKSGQEIAGLDCFENAIRPDVCHAGGDAVIAMPPDDEGRYATATVITLAQTQETAAVCRRP